MPLPSAIVTTEVTGQYLDMSGNPMAGSVTFTPVITGAFEDAGDGVILLPDPVTAELDVDGAFHLELPCTDNTAMSPTGFAYRVEEILTGGFARTYAVALPSTLGSPVDLASLAPVNPPGPVSTLYGVLAAGNNWTGTNTFHGPTVFDGPVTLPGGAGGTDWLSAADYGAIGDGAHDDTTALTHWINAINAANGGTGGAGGFLPSGEYVISSPLPAITNNGVTITGDGWCETDFASGSVISCGNLSGSITYSGGAPVTLTGEGVCLRNWMVNGYGTPATLIAVAGGNARLESMGTHGVASGGVCIDVQAGGYSCWITGGRHNGINGPNVGVQVNDTDLILTAAKVENNGYSVKLLDGASGAMIEDCHFTPGTNGRNAILLVNSPNNISIVGNRIDNHYLGAAIQLSAASDTNAINITGNLFYQNTLSSPWPAIAIDTTNSNPYNTSITGNTVRGASGNMYSALLAALTSAGAVATNPGRITTAGVLVSGNAVYASALYGTSTAPTGASTNLLSTDGVTWTAVAGGAPTSTYNVKAYGAAGDGVTDDTAAIAAAIAAAEAANGGEVFFPEGQYKCSTVTSGSIFTITSPSIRFKGVGWDQTDFSTMGSWLVCGQTCTNFVNVVGSGTVGGSTFTAESMGFNGGAKATNILNTSGLNTLITRCYLRAPNTNGTSINVAAGGTSAWIINNRTSGNNVAGTIGIQINDTDSIVSGNKPQNCVHAIVLLSGAVGALIQGNHPTPGSTIGVSCVWVNGNAARIAINGNRWDNHAFGPAVQITPTSTAEIGVVIANNVFYQNVLAAPPAGAMTPAAIQVDTTNGPMTQLVITGNMIQSGGSTQYSSLLAAAAQYAGSVTGVQATSNPGYISTGGTVVTDNSVSAAAFLQSGIAPLVNSNNVFSSDGVTWSQVGATSFPGFDGVTTDLQPSGTPASGSGTGLAAYSGHVHPNQAAIFRVQDTTYLAWNFDPADMASSSTPGNGVINWIRVNIWQTIAVSNVILYLQTLGVGLATGNYTGLYTSGGTQIGVSADQTTNWGTGTNSQPRPHALTGGSGPPYTLTAGTYVYVPILANFTTGGSNANPAFGRKNSFASGAANAGLSASAYRWGTNGSGTTLPGSFTPSSLAASSAEYFVAFT